MCIDLKRNKSRKKRVQRFGDWEATYVPMASETNSLVSSVRVANCQLRHDSFANVPRHRASSHNIIADAEHQLLNNRKLLLCFIEQNLCIIFHTIPFRSSRVCCKLST